jgi:hypothetical protein
MKVVRSVPDSTLEYIIGFFTTKTDSLYQFTNYLSTVSPTIQNRATQSYDMSPLEGWLLLV